MQQVELLACVANHYYRNLEQYGCINFWNTTYMCGIVACCNLFPSTQLFCQQLFGQILSLYNETPSILSLTLSKWRLRSLYSDLIQCETWSTLNLFNAGLVQCENSLKLDSFDAGLVWQLTSQLMLNLFEWVKLNNVTHLPLPASHATMWLICCFLSLNKATHLPLSLTQQGNSFASFSYSPVQLGCQYLLLWLNQYLLLSLNNATHLCFTLIQQGKFFDTFSLSFMQQYNLLASYYHSTMWHVSCLLSK